MSTQVQCPLCTLILRHDKPKDPQWGVFFKDSAILDIGQVETHIEICFCPCGRATWIQDKGWTLSFDFFSKIKADLWANDQSLHQKIVAFLTDYMPKEMKNAEIPLDRSTVKLYCSNDKCEVKGYITRTKAQAEKTLHICDICNSPLKW